METTAEADDDPRAWSIDRVVYELCHAPNPQWLPSANSQYKQNRQALEPTFRQNDIDGDSLLTLEMPALKEELGIVSYGIRNVIMKAINFFRAKSRSYQQMLFQVDNIARMQAIIFPSPQITHPRFSAAPQSPVYYGMGIHPSIETHHTPSPLLASGFGQQRAPPPPPPPPPEKPRPSGPELMAPRLTDDSHTSTDLPHIPAIKPIQELEPSSAVAPRAEEADSRTGNETQPSAPLSRDQQSSKASGKKRIAPTLISHLPENAPPRSNDEGYLAEDAVPIQDIFYYKRSTTIEGDETYRAPLDENRQFDVSIRVPSGQRRAVARLMRSFLLRGTEVLPSSGLRVRVPYDESLVKGPFSRQYFTLFLPGSLLPRVRSVEEYPELKALNLSKVRKGRRSVSSTTREAHHANDEDDGTVSVRGGVVGSDLDYLLDKYPPQDLDEGLPLYGDSGDEGDYDEATWMEMEEEKAEDVEYRSRPANLTPAQVEIAIDEAVEDFKHEWWETKLAGVQKRAYRHWIEAARLKNRQPKIQYFRKSKDHCLQRMMKLRREVAGNTWRNAAEVKRQCQVLEVTVHQHEEYSYYAQVMLQDSPPEKPSKEALSKAYVPKQHDLEEGEEIIESEPEAYSEDDDHTFIDDNEIDDNSSDLGSIHHDPEAEEWNPENWKPINRTDKGVPEPTVAKAGSPLGTQKSPLDDTLMPDANADDADVESDDDDDIITPNRRKTKLTIAKVVPQTPVARRQVPLTKPEPSLAKEARSSDDSDLDRTPRLPKSKYRDRGRSTAAPIDLTVDSPFSGLERTTSGPSSDFSVHTPKLNPVQVKPHKKTPSHVSETADSGPCHTSSHDDTNLPKWDDVEGMRAAYWSDMEPADTRRALAKCVFTLAEESAVDLASLLTTLSTDEVREKCLVEGLAIVHLKGFRVTALPRKDQSSARILVLLYVTHCTGYNALENPVNQVHRQQAYKDKDTAIRPFFETLGKLLRVRFKHDAQKKGQKRKRDQEALSDIEMLDDTETGIADYISTDDLEAAVRPSSHKKRKRKVEESQEAMSQQYNDKMRIQAQEKRRKDMAKKLAMMQPDGTTDSHVIINTEEPLIELHEHIAGRVKPHQVAGLQFMWREIIEDPKHQGCILAHTMGLGKTMQVVSLLVTISLCSQSSDPKVRQLIPQHLQRNKTLILAPASLLNNWEDELLMWTPQGTTILGAIHKCDLPRAEDNTRAIMNWSKKGGVLLMGYERFRLSITNSIKDKKKGAVAVDLEQILLEVPSIVIADEAHTLKNPKSKINEYSKRFKTISRIALTGSPLNNHLEEYHTLVDWIAPGYLGTMVQFRVKYSEPIRDGLWSDSTAHEKRLALRKLHVLKRDLDPKINRADITAIENDMPSKTEFFITIPLTPLQTEAYNIYVHHMVQTYALMGAGSSHARIWDWIAMLSWLCHHPAGFVTKLQERQRKALEGKDVRNQISNAQDLSESSDEGPVVEEGRTPEAIKEDTDVDVTGPMRQAMEAVLQILPDINDRAALFDPSLSYRTLAVQRIVEKATEAGDKTLIFSHSIPTLNYLADMLAAMNCTFCRIDGKTKVSERQAQVKEFNEKDRFQVFLISMRAGGLGLNLQGANRVIVFDFSFNPIWEQQAIGRAYRLNQKRPVFVYRFQAGGTFEDKLFNTAVFKTQLFGRVVDKKAPRPNASKKTDMQYLFPVKEVPQEDFSESLGKDPKVLDAIIHDLGFVRSIVLTETFQKEDDERLDAEEQKAAEEEYQNERLQRDDPVAWQAKEMARLAQERKQQQQLQQAAFYHPTPPMPHHLLNGSAFTPFPAPATSGVPRSKKYSFVQPPFGREDVRKLAQPERPQPVQNTNNPSVRGAYDDTYWNPNQINRPASSHDRDGRS
ncbi:putative SNF2 family helicase/ATPase [Cladophialophora carrionii]|uniref:Putative SNF2 family helicase/ATPase n=1 Tax=Cladophialophora carrionii TaxID=86049 RepID=A0A1C1D2H1_9EURO|nr:putative SNF2 family helicase/ATPase [Cladophialophora carrionii]